VNVGSLFAGIGGFDLGFERAGMRVAWQVELDPYCRAVLAHHFPEARRYEDVREVGAANLAPVDLICGGFPCQDLSPAGRGAGLDGARSGLWAEFARIVRELRPRYVVVENVPALLTGKGKRWDRGPIGRVLGDLAEARYDAEWACLSA
jgi:DNA (cytosine-5)-methyltransferase 1